MCNDFEALSELRREKSAWVFSDPADLWVFLPPCSDRGRSKANTGGALEGQSQVIALGRILDSSSVSVGSETGHGAAQRESFPGAPVHNKYGDITGINCSSVASETQLSILIPYIIVIRTSGPLLLKKMVPQQRRYTNRPRSKCSFSVGEVHTFPIH